MNVITNMRFKLNHMKKIILACIITCIAVFGFAQTPTIGDYRSAVITGNWSSLSTWQVRDASGNWTTPSSLPTSANNVYIQKNHTITVDVANVYCNDLHLNIAGILTIGSNLVSISGKIRADSMATASVAIVGATDATFYTDNGNYATLNASMVTSNVNGGLKFVGTTRNLNLLGEWNSNGTGNVSVIFALNPGETGTTNAGFKAKTFVFQSGITSAASGAFMSAGAVGTGTSFLIKSGAKFTTARSGATNSAIGFSSTKKCDNITIENGGILEFNASTPTVDCASFTNNGTVIYLAGTGPLAAPTANGVTDGAVNLTSYKNLVLGGSGVKNIPSGINITVSDTLKLEGTSSCILGSVLGSSLTYGSNATLVCNMTTGTATFLAGSIEWPATNGPKNIEFRKNTVTFTASAANRTITGSLYFTGGSYTVNTGDTLFMSNNSSLIRRSTVGGLNVSGVYLIGSSSADQVTVVIDSASSILETKEFQPNVASVGKLNLTITSGTTYTAGARSVYNFNNSGTFVMGASGFIISGDILGNGTITGNAAYSLTIQGSLPGPTTSTLNFTTGFANLYDFTINRTGASASIIMGTNLTVARDLFLTAGVLNDNGKIINVTRHLSYSGAAVGTGTHVSGIGGKIVMLCNSGAQSTYYIGSTSLGNLEFNYSTYKLPRAATSFTVDNLTFVQPNNKFNLFGYNVTIKKDLIGNGNDSIVNLTIPTIANAHLTMSGASNVISGITVMDTLEFSSGANITSNLAFSAKKLIINGTFNDGGYSITNSGDLIGTGTHTGSGRIIMNTAGKNISGSGLTLGNLEIATSTSGITTGGTNFAVAQDLILTSGILADGGNTITINQNLSGVTGKHTGLGKIKMTGSSNTISTVQVDSIEIAIGASITASSDFRINKDLLLNGTINDGGNIISIYGSIIGSGLHTGSGKISMVGSAKSIVGGTRINNIEITSGASISTTAPALGCSAFISGLLNMNGGNLGIGLGNTLTMKNGSSIYRTTGNLNLNSGTMVMGEAASDTISVTINGDLLSSNELPGSPVGKIDLTINDGFTYTLRSNNKTVRNLYLNSGQLLSDPADLPLIYGITSTGTATLAGDYYLNAGLNIKGIFKFDDNANGKTLDANGFLTFKSTASVTGSLAPVLNNNNIIGDAIVERFIQNKKAWRLLYMPTLHTTQNIHDAWQEGGVNNDNPNPGYGIQITSNDANWQINGFDTLSRTPSVKYFEPSTNDWVGIPSTSIAFEQGQAYMAFIRGNRSVTSFGQTSTSTTLRELGNLHIGNVTWNNLGTAGNQFVAIGNPYPSAISLLNVTKNNLDNAFYVWDPVLTGINGFGAYQTMSVVGGNVVVAPSLGGSYITNTNIESGQGFFVHTTGGAGSITFHETDKEAGSNLVARAPSQMSSIRLNLFKNINNEFALMDGVLHIFDSSYSNDVNNSDALKLFNPTENIAIKLSDKSLSIEARSVLNVNDTLHYALSQMKVGTYKFEISPEYLNTNNLAGLLVDNYLHVTLPVSLINSTSVSFDINNDVGSYASDRFYMIFKTLRTTPVKFIDVSAREQDQNILVSWNVENEININKYVVERSINGINFIEIGFKAANQSLNYSFIDDKSFQNIIYYRIKSIGDAGEIMYSKIVRVSINKKIDPGFTISPNPINETREVNVSFENIPAGDYEIGLYDFSGRKVFSEKIMHQFNDNQIKIKLLKSITAGSYNMIFCGENGFKMSKKLLIK